jgi:hypothetical protein
MENPMRTHRIISPAPDRTGRIIGCRSCYGYGRPGSVRVPETDAAAPGGARWVWQDCPERCTPQTRRDVIERELSARGIVLPGANGTEDQEVTAEPAAPVPALVPAPERVRVDVPVVATVLSSAPAGKARRATRRQESRPVVAAVALDAADGEQLLADVDGMSAPDGATLADVFGWIAAVGPCVGVPRLHADVRGSDGTVCLSAAVLRAVKLPAKLPATPAAMDKVAAKMRKAATVAGLELGETIGAGFKAFRRATSGGGPRLSVRVLVVPWLGQGDKGAVASGSLVTALADDGTGTPDAGTLARRMRRFVADLGVTPGSTAAVTSRQLLEAVRPRFGWTQDDAGRWTSALRAGALPDGDTTVPVAAGARHPLTRERAAARELLCEEEDFKWWAREMTPQESTMPYAVAVDACASYLSVTETLRLPSGPLRHTTSPVWDKADAGLWLCDFTGLPVETQLPHFASFTGDAPTGPGWYATPTVAYAVTAYGFDPSGITEAFISEHTVAFLKEWTQHVRAAYKAVMGVLGVPDTLTGPEFLAAWDVRKDVADDAGRDAVVLVDAYKAIYKGGVGKWADSARHRGDDEWLSQVAGAWHYRPEVRFHIIAAARIAGHRRMRKTLVQTGRAPFAINVDQLMYAAPSADPSSLLAVDGDGKPVPGTVRLGSAPGSYKYDSAVPMDRVRELLAEKVHPSRATHEYDVTGSPVETMEG